MNDIMYSFDEIGLLPAGLSQVEHRSDVNPYIDGKLPVFVSPMTCILNRDNFETFNKSKFIPILPVTAERLHTLDATEDWQALTLQDFAYFFNGCKAIEGINYHILIDCANGNMDSLYASVRDAKQEYGGNLTIMIGNIANPATYIECCKANVDYVRVGIGGGRGCTTSVQTGIHASLPWLLTEIKEIKESWYLTADDSNKAKKCTFTEWLETHRYTRTKIVADGGISSISDAIKALALGADYVMCGKLFAQCQEACGEAVPDIDSYRYYYGQASIKGQKDRFGVVRSNPEGTEIVVPVDTTLEKFAFSFSAALRSAMSYAGADTLNKFIGKVNYKIMSYREFTRYDK